MRENLKEQGMAEQEVKLLDLAFIFAKNKMFLLKFVGSVVGLTILYCLLLPNVYTGTAKVLPPQKEGLGGLSALSAMFGQGGGLASFAGGMFGGNSELYLGILKSRSVEDAVIKKLGLAKIYETKTPEETRKALEGSVTLQSGKDGIITIEADDEDPKLAAAIANAFVEELGRKSVQLNLNKAGTERVFLEKRLGLVKEDLRKAEDSLKAFQEKNKAIKVDSQAVATIQGIAQMKAELISREIELASLRSYQTEQNPQVKLLKTAIARLKSQLGDYEGSGMVGQAIPSIGNVPNLGLEFARRLREVKVQEAIFEQLTKQYEVAKLTEAKDSSSIQVLDEAVVPMKKSKPKRALIVIIVTFAAAFVGIFLAFMREYLEKLPEEDRARWQELQGMFRFRLPKMPFRK